MKTIAIILAAAGLAACANSSGVHSTDKDSFAVTVEASPGKGGIVAARRIAYEEATAHCAPRAVQRISELEHETSWNETMKRFTLDFRCSTT